MLTPLRLIVGLGNPGNEFELTRHNAGARWVRSFADRFNISLRHDSVRRAEVGRGIVLDHDIRLMVPSTFMNNSGEAVAPYLRYFKIAPEEMLVVIDEVAFEAGVSKLKFGGGLNGHNGLKDIVKHLENNKEFGRLRIGIGHPGDSSEMVPFLTRVAMPQLDREKASDSSYLSDEITEWLLAGDWQRAMTALHTDPNEGNQ